MNAESGRLTRRGLLAQAGAGLAGLALAMTERRASWLTRGVSNTSAAVVFDLHGRDLSGWRLALGDGVYPHGEVSISDIETVHHDTYSEVRANIDKRQIMAHNITYRREPSSENPMAAIALACVHSFAGYFRLPYMPSIDNSDENAQTLDAGLFVWDGRPESMLDYGAAFQWGLNPNDGAESFGVVRSSIEGANAAAWEPVGFLKPDLEWHTFELLVDYPQQLTQLYIDGQQLASYFVGIYKNWPRNVISAGVQLEAISILPTATVSGALHRVEYRDWRWRWMLPVARYLPYLANDGI